MFIELTFKNNVKPTSGERKSFQYIILQNLDEEMKQQSSPTAHY